MALPACARNAVFGGLYAPRAAAPAAAVSRLTATVGAPAAATAATRAAATAATRAAATATATATRSRSYCSNRLARQQHHMPLGGLSVSLHLLSSRWEQGQQLLLFQGEAPAAAAAAAKELPRQHGLLLQRRRLHRSHCMRQRDEQKQQEQQQQEQQQQHGEPPAPAVAAVAAETSEAAARGPPEAPLQLRASFAARPPPQEAPREQRWSTWAKVSIFVIISASPFVLAALVFKCLLQEKEEQQALAQMAAKDPEIALKTAQQVVALASTCLCIAGGVKDGLIVSASVVPHFPETRVLRLPSNEVIQGIPNNAITYLVAGERSEFSLPFNFVHFALSASSDVFQKIKAGESVSLLYVEPLSGDTVLLTGVAAILDTPAYKSHYWRSSWAASLPGGESSPDYKLIKFVPGSMAIDLGARGPDRWTPIKLSRIITENNIYWALDEKRPQAKS